MRLGNLFTVPTAMDAAAITCDAAWQFLGSTMTFQANQATTFTMATISNRCWKFRVRTPGSGTTYSVNFDQFHS